jgi:hypothetical protein
MDSDDISLPDRFAKQVELLENRPEVGLCGTRCCFFGAGGEYIGAMPPVEPNQIKASLLFLPTLSNTSLMMRHDLVRAENLYYDEALVSAEDYDLSFRFSRHCKITNLEEVLMRIRVHDGSLTQRIKGENDRWLSEVHRRVLLELKIEASDEDLRMHLSVSTGNHRKSREYVESVERWLLRLMDANESSAFCDPRAFAWMLFEKWRPTCAFVPVFGLWTWRKLLQSRLSDGFSLPKRLKVSFFLKCLLKKELLRPARARVN